MVLAHNTSRLPTTASPPSRGTEIVKGILAFICTAALVVGVPVGLLAAAGPPWPSSLPARSWRSAESSGSAFLEVLAVVVWLSWAHFVVCLAVEVTAERHARSLAPRVPGGGVGTQMLARKMVGTIVLVV